MADRNNGVSWHISVFHKGGVIARLIPRQSADSAKAHQMDNLGGAVGAPFLSLLKSLQARGHAMLNCKRCIDFHTSTFCTVGRRFKG